MLFTGWEVQTEKYFLDVSKTARGLVWLTNSKDVLLKKPLVWTKLLLLTKHDNGTGKCRTLLK